MKSHDFFLRNAKDESFGHHFIHTTLPTCACAFFLILTLLILFLSPYSAIYNSTIESNPNQFVLGVPQTKLATQQTLHYLWFGSALTIDLSQQARQHMVDVRSLFVIGQILFVLFAILTYVALRNKSVREKAKLLIWSSASAITTIVLLLLTSLFGFDRVFTLFHELLFTNKLWLFAPNDTLILYFPQYFFATIALRLVIWLVLSLLLFLLVIIIYERRQRFSSSKPAQHI